MSFQYFRPNICFYYLKKVRVSGSDNIEIVKHIYIIHAIYLINSKRRSKKGSLMIRVMMFCFVSDHARKGVATFVRLYI